MDSRYTTANGSAATDVWIKTGMGNWSAFGESGLTVDEIFGAAEDWKRALDGITRPWLCWNVNSDWSVVQQRLVRSVGWTPVVGFDPRAGHLP